MPGSVGCFRKLLKQLSISGILKTKIPIMLDVEKDQLIVDPAPSQSGMVEIKHWPASQSYGAHAKKGARSA